MHATQGVACATFVGERQWLLAPSDALELAYYKLLRKSRGWNLKFLEQRRMTRFPQDFNCELDYPAREQGLPVRILRATLPE